MSLFKRMKKWTRSQTYLAWGAGLLAPLCLSLGYCMAEGPESESQMIEGRVKSMTKAPKGEIDGAILDDGSTLHWPPHLEERFTKIVKQGGQVRATGRMERAPRGESHFEVETVTDVQSNQSVTNEDFRAKPPRPPHARGNRDPHPAPPPRKAELRRETETITGTIKQFTEAPRGETDGALLADGTRLHWPPHLGERFAALIKVGDQVSATGRRETAPRGEENFEIQKLTNSRDSKTEENPDYFGPDRPGPGRNERPGRDAKRFDELQRLIDQMQRELDRLRDEN